MDVDKHLNYIKNKYNIKESEELEEKLDPSMGVKKYIDDFIKSDNPKFEGKSKKERMQMALGAYYAAKKGTNEEAEELDEETEESRTYRVQFDHGPMSAYGINREEASQHITLPGRSHTKKDIEKHLSKKFENPKVFRSMEIDPKLVTNEEAENIQELSPELLGRYIQGRQWDTGTTPEMQNKMNTGLARAEKKIAKKKETENEHN